MKKLIAVALIALILGAPAVRAQEPSFKNEIDVSWGAFPFQDFIMGYGAILLTIFSLGSLSFENGFSTGTVNVEYYRTLNKTFAVGGIVNGLFAGADVMKRQSGEYVKDGELRYGSIFLMPSAKAYWFRHSHFSMYSKLGLGAGLFFSAGSSSEDLPEFIPAAQLSPVAIELGGDQHRGFLEIGAGMQGLLVAGYRYAF
ncbi:MAG: hypothetical protein IJV01_03990 [Bacteroidales bacterium]|nr:hypothetical protein [Bacteroidales bacterium]